MVREDLSYNINKGVNRAIEFRGLKGQYIYYLAIGLAVLLIGFAAMYILGVPIYVCLPVVLIAGGALFWLVFRLSYQYGVHGLMKAMAYRQVPTALILRSRKVFEQLKKEKKGNCDDGSSGHGNFDRGCSNVEKERNYQQR